jgi:hypothetical protein
MFGTYECFTRGDMEKGYGSEDPTSTYVKCGERREKTWLGIPKSGFLFSLSLDSNFRDAKHITDFSCRLWALVSFCLAYFVGTDHSHCPHRPDAHQNLQAKVVIRLICMESLKAGSDQPFPHSSSVRIGLPVPRDRASEPRLPRHRS